MRAQIEDIAFWRKKNPRQSAGFDEICALVYISLQAAATKAGIVYVTFPKSKLTAHITPEWIEREGAKKFKEWRGLEKLQTRLKGGS